MKAFLYIVVVGGLGLFMYTTKPSKVDYFEKIDVRAASLSGTDQRALFYGGGVSPFDEMVVSEPTSKLFKQTQVSDYVFFAVFTTEYEARGYGKRRVRTYGLFSSLLTFRAD